MQQQGKLNPQVIAQLANEQMLENFIEQQCVNASGLFLFIIVFLHGTYVTSSSLFLV